MELGLRGDKSLERQHGRVVVKLHAVGDWNLYLCESDEQATRLCKVLSAADECVKAVEDLYLRETIGLLPDNQHWTLQSAYAALGLETKG